MSFLTIGLTESTLCREWNSNKNICIEFLKEKPETRQKLYELDEWLFRPEHLNNGIYDFIMKTSAVFDESCRDIYKLRYAVKYPECEAREQVLMSVYFGRIDNGLKLGLIGRLNEGKVLSQDVIRLIIGGNYKFGVVAQIDEYLGMLGEVEYEIELEPEVSPDLATELEPEIVSDSSSGIDMKLENKTFEPVVITTKTVPESVKNLLKKVVPEKVNCKKVATEKIAVEKVAFVEQKATVEKKKTVKKIKKRRKSIFQDCVFSPPILEIPQDEPDEVFDHVDAVNSKLSLTKSEMTKVETNTGLEKKTVSKIRRPSVVSLGEPVPEIKIPEPKKPTRVRLYSTEPETPPKFEVFDSDFNEISPKSFRKIGEHNRWRTILSSPLLLRKSIYKMKIKLNKKSEKQPHFVIMLGIVEIENPTSTVLISETGYGYYTYPGYSLYRNGHDAITQSKMVNHHVVVEGDELEVIFDSSELKLNFLVNGVGLMDSKNVDASKLTFSTGKDVYLVDESAEGLNYRFALSMWANGEELSYDFE